MQVARELEYAGHFSSILKNYARESLDSEKNILNFHSNNSTVKGKATVFRLNCGITTAVVKCQFLKQFTISRDSLSKNFFEIIYSVKGDCVYQTANGIIGPSKNKFSVFHVLPYHFSAFKHHIMKGPHHFISVTVEKDLFLNHFRLPENYFEIFEQRGGRHDGFLIERNSSFLGTEQMFIKDLFNTSRLSILQTLRVEAISLYLLSLRFGQVLKRMDSSKRVLANSDLNMADIERIISARSYLISQYQNPPQLKELSKIVGINLLKLKKGFNLLYYTPPYTYVKSYRMKKAVQHMENNPELSINEIADLVGYRNHSHFTTQFKREFGLLPTDFKKTLE